MIAVDLTAEARRQCTALDQDEPYADADASQDLGRLNRMIRSLVGDGIGWRLVAKPVSAATTAWSGYAYQANTSAAGFTLKAPANGREGQSWSITDVGLSFDQHHLTIDGNGALIEGGTAPLVLSVQGDRRTWFYRADTGGWERIRDLGLNDQMYFPEDVCDALIWLLADRIAPIYGTQATLDQAKVAAAEAAFRARYGRRRPQMAPTPQRQGG